ncbi:MAG: ACT domain-containing protein, partial [Actinobacteria bacterium]|nr:ACT domain-containing protein [Actinomycetota bacterium]
NLPDARVIPTSSTAAAAEAVAAGTDEFTAAIGNALAAQRFGLVSLADDIADNREALTRFVRVERPGTLPAPTGCDKTSLLLFMKANRSGALLEILTEFAVRGINMTRLESRPTRQVLGEYCFSVDIEGHVAEARIGEALIGLHRICADVVFLGSYPRLDGVASIVPEG